MRRPRPVRQVESRSSGRAGLREEPGPEDQPDDGNGDVDPEDGPPPQAEHVGVDEEAAAHAVEPEHRAGPEMTHAAVLAVQFDLPVLDDDQRPGPVTPVIGQPGSRGDRHLRASGRRSRGGPIAAPTRAVDVAGDRDATAVVGVTVVVGLGDRFRLGLGGGGRASARVRAAAPAGAGRLSWEPAQPRVRRPGPRELLWLKRPSWRSASRLRSSPPRRHRRGRGGRGRDVGRPAGRCSDRVVPAPDAHHDHQQQGGDPHPDPHRLAEAPPPSAVPRPAPVRPSVRPAGRAGGRAERPGPAAWVVPGSGSAPRHPRGGRGAAVRPRSHASRGGREPRTRDGRHGAGRPPPARRSAAPCGRSTPRRAARRAVPRCRAAR